MRLIIDGSRRGERDRAGEVAGDHRVGDCPTPLHVLLAQAPRLVGGEHQRIAPWRMAQKSAPKEFDTPIGRWHCVDFLLWPGIAPGGFSEREDQGQRSCPWSR